jgi:hypothetical protein
VRRGWTGLGVVVAAISIVRFAGATPPPPSSIVSLGGGESASRSSWSTSTIPQVSSFRLRYSKSRPLRGVHVRAYSFATDAFSVADLVRQARAAVARAPGSYVTLELGVRDLCMGRPLQTFQVELDRGLRVLSKVGRTAGVLVVSIEDLTREWRVLRADPAAARALRTGRRLDCNLGYRVPAARLAQIRARTMALNDILAEVCFRNHLCLFDNGTRFRLPLKASYFSAADPRRLSVAGQRVLAAAEWKPALLLISAAG